MRDPHREISLKNPLFGALVRQWRAFTGSVRTAPGHENRHQIVNNLSRRERRNHSGISRERGMPADGQRETLAARLQSRVGAERQRHEIAAVTKTQAGDDGQARDGPHMLDHCREVVPVVDGCQLAADEVA